MQVYRNILYYVRCKRSYYVSVNDLINPIPSFHTERNKVATNYIPVYLKKIHISKQKYSFSMEKQSRPSLVDNLVLATTLFQTLPTFESLKRASASGQRIYFIDNFFSQRSVVIRFSYRFHIQN